MHFPSIRCRQAALSLCFSILCLSTAPGGSASYQYFRFTPTKLRNNGSANSVQLSEMQLFLDASQITGATASNPGGSNPGGEQPSRAVDGSTSTKWLDFNKGALVLNFGSVRTVNGYRWATANDATERDPVRWRFEGSNNGINWTLLDDQSGSDYPVPGSRFTYLPTLGFNQVPDAPVIEFTISAGAVTSDTAVGVASGQQVTLSWNVTNGATSQTLDLGAGPQPVAASGSTTHNPVATQSYTLAADGTGGSSSESVTAYVGSSVSPPVINELLADASGDAVICDEDGDASDWIELHNPNIFAIDAGGYFLTDDPLTPMRWEIPAGTVIEPEGWLVIFASGKNRSISGAELHTNFSLGQNGEYLALIDTDGVTELDAYSPEFPAQTTDVSYGRVPPVSADVFNFFIAPTPNAANDTPPGAPGEVVVFDTPAATFTGSIQVSLSKTSPTAEIRYTTDGSLPGPSSTLYTAPFTLNNSALVRARVYDAGFAPGEVKAEAYIELSAAVASQTSDLPVVILENFNEGAVPTGSNLQTAYFTLHEPDEVTGRTALTALPTKANRAGIKRRGSSTLNDPKGNYRVEFWRDDSEEEKNLNILGMSDHDEWILFAPYNFDRSLVRIPFIHDLSNAIGAYAPRGRLCEVYLNTGGGALATSDYQGVYVLQERISRDKDRVDVEKLTKNDLTEPNITGGYIISIDRLDPEDSGFRSALNHPEDPAIASPQPFFTYVYPKEQNILPQQSAYIRGYIDDLEAALYGPNYKDPALGYQAWLDCDAAIDHHILVTFTKDPDALRLSTYLYKPRGGKLAFGPIWDFDRTMGCDSDARASNPLGWDPPNETAQFFEYDYWGRLFDDNNFWQKWIDRWQSLRDGEFSNVNLRARVDALAAEVDESQPRNAARWPAVAPNGGNLTALNGWDGEIDHLKNWLTQRADWIDSQFVTRPVLQASGQVSGSPTATATEGTLYYTVDGTDPRLPGGGISGNATAVSGTGSIAVPATITVIARNRSGGNWSGPVTATYIVGQPATASNLVVSEIMYHPLDATTAEQNAGFSTASDFEFLELQNISGSVIDLTGVVISDVFDFSFLNAAVTTLAPGEVVLLVRNQAAFEARYGSGLPVAGEWGSQKLSNDGELIVITGVEGTIRSFEYNDSVDWPQRADGDGESLTLIDPFSIPDHSLPESWRNSVSPLGTPGSGHTDLCDEWRHLHFSGADLTDPEVSGDDADPDRDGLVNFMELALSADPNSPSFDRLPTVEITTITNDVPEPGDYITVTFTRRVGLGGVTVVPAFSTDLTNWTTDGVLLNIIPNSDGTETATYRDTAVWNDTTRFVRIIAEKP